MNVYFSVPISINIYLDILSVCTFVCALTQTLKRKMIQLGKKSALFIHKKFVSCCKKKKHVNFIWKKWKYVFRYALLRVGCFLLFLNKNGEKSRYQ